MADLFVHIGLNKTGTSSIQDFLGMNAEALSAEGLHFPAAGRDGGPAHHALSYWLKKLPDDADPAAAGIGQALLRELEGVRRAVLSSEDLHTLGPRAIKLLAKLFAGHRVTIVLYVREHLGYLSSWYQQNVQASHLSCAFDTFCYFTRTQLHAICDRWAEGFGQEHVRVYLYDRSSLAGGDIVRDFAVQVGIAGDLQRFKRKPYESNPSVAGNLLYVKRLLNNFLDKATATHLSDEITVLSQLRPEFRGAMHVDDAVMSYVNGMYAADRAKLHKRYGIRIEAPDASRGGRLTPEYATLPRDWELLQKESDAKSLKMAGFLKLVSLGNLAVLEA